MSGNVKGLGRSFLNSRAIWLLCWCLCGDPVALAQPNGSSDFRISSRVQRLLDDASECRDNNDFDCARASLSKITRRSLSDNEQFRYWQSLGQVEFYDGNFPDAIEAFGNAAELAPRAGARVDYVRYVAQLHASMGQFQPAYETLEGLIAEGGADQYPRLYQFRFTAEQQASEGEFQAAYDTLEVMLVRNGVVPLAWRHLTNDALWRGLDIYATGDRELEPLVAESPLYPPEAVSEGLASGFVDVEFTVTRTGSTRDVHVVESSATVFEGSATEAAELLRYKPRLMNGKPVETVVQRRIEFQTQESD